MKKSPLFCILPLLAAVSITACGSGQSKNFAVEETAAVTAMDSNSQSDYGEAPAPGSRDGAEYEGLNSESGSMTAIPAGRKLIRTVSMQVETDTFDQLLQSITAKITELGGYIEQSDITGSSLNYRGEPTPKNAQLTARIPDDRLSGFITVVEDSGNVTNKSESTEDVTLKYSDVESRKKSLEIEQERIWQFLERAESIDTVISLEERLSEIRYQLESMESQLRLYDNQVEYSTVHLSLYEVKRYTPTEPESVGNRIKNGLADNITALATTLTSLLINFIISSPYWILLALIVYITYRLIRRQNKKRARKAPKPASPDAIQASPDAPPADSSEPPTGK